MDTRWYAIFAAILSLLFLELGIVAHETSWLWTPLSVALMLVTWAITFYYYSRSPERISLDRAFMVGVIAGILYWIASTTDWGNPPAVRWLSSLFIGFTLISVVVWAAGTRMTRSTS